jgi:hypothetical protein
VNPLSFVVGVVIMGDVVNPLSFAVTAPDRFTGRVIIFGDCKVVRKFQF